jgi:rhodanese-related sulfurtransferase
MWRPISTAELKELISSNKDFCLVNVLPKILHDTEHIEGSINIPLSQVNTTENLPKNKQKPLIFYCMGIL